MLLTKTCCCNACCDWVSRICWECLTIWSKREISSSSSAVVPLVVLEYSPPESSDRIWLLAPFPVRTSFPEEGINVIPDSLLVPHAVLLNCIDDDFESVTVLWISHTLASSCSNLLEMELRLAKVLACSLIRNMISGEGVKGTPSLDSLKTVSSAGWLEYCCVVEVDCRWRLDLSGLASRCERSNRTEDSLVLTLVLVVEWSVSVFTDDFMPKGLLSEATEDLEADGGILLESSSESSMPTTLRSWLWLLWVLLLIRTTWLLLFRWSDGCCWEEDISLVKAKFKVLWEDLCQQMNLFFVCWVGCRTAILEQSLRSIGTLVAVKVVKAWSCRRWWWFRNYYTPLERNGKGSSIFG